ncbi:MAG: Factor arrest protein 11 [Alectoria sarmentosa]|nr:MAG: Factor arrest protein 11 [Alectoria sarmentosa]
MDYTEPEGSNDEGDAIIVKADEVDEAGADISTISPTDVPESEFTERIESRRAHDAQSSPKILANAVPSPPRAINRPILRREGSALPPPQQAPPAPPQRQEEQKNPTDSLSLLELKRLVTDLPKLEPTAYAYDYSETRSFPEELEEWFSYTEEERYMLLRAKQTFDEKWEQAQAEQPVSSDKALQWQDVSEEDRESFMIGAIQALQNPEISSRVKSLECLSYVALGVWGDTAGIEKEDERNDLTAVDNKWLDSSNTKSKLQLKWIVNGTRMLCELDAVQKLLDVLIKLWESEQDVDMSDDGPPSQDDKIASWRFLRQIEVNQTLTALYLIIEASRWQRSKGEDGSMQEAIAGIGSCILTVLTKMIAKLRWEETSYIPLPRIVLLFWKTVLLFFGNIKEIDESKVALRQELDISENEHDPSFITTSPLDYHLFRQEITSKYPAYCPPPPLVPIEEENNSILPPLPNHPTRQASIENLRMAAGATANGAGRSIFHQPVHIATPAPSPPPSPAGPGGKGGKKQNYQTNQNFPFLYPPLDDTSNTVGGKGSAELQGQLVGKRWEGSDVPASILEAGQLFASRMRMSRSIRQLWDVREKFIKYERGWNRSKDDYDSPHEDSEFGSNDDDTEGEAERSSARSKDEEPKWEKETDKEEVQRRLDAINSFYRDNLPHLQSVVVVFWKLVFSHVSSLVAQNGREGLQNGMPFPEDGSSEAQSKRRANNSSANINSMANGQLAENEDGTDPVVEELNALRSKEITTKAVSGILLILLKWFKLSHILKYEYMTQLLLDANYLPLVLKLFAHQDVDRAVDQKNDREDLDFFYFCHLNSKHPPISPPQPALSPSTSSDDEAAPPPILKHRRSPTSQSPPPTPPLPITRPEVDELGYPTSGALPQTPLTNYAPRFFLTNINLLRLLQKITKRKAHRALLLVQYKSSTILRKALKIPQPDLRLYTLKLFKSQTPYCGRKWRQTNMRVITAIYLHCRPELRDEWLCGGDVDGVVEEAVPLEQAGRSLVHWWHLREFRGVMEGDGERKGGEDGKEEDNFFAWELEKMGWGFGAVGPAEEEDPAVREGAGGGGVGTEFEGGPLAMEGWA